MAKKPKMGKVDRLDPRKNKSLAIRMVLKKLPGAKASAIVEEVKKEFGHQVGQNMVYMVKTKTNMASDGRPKRSKDGKKDSPMTSALLWVAAMKTGRQLLRETGGVANATALLKALEQ